MSVPPDVMKRRQSELRSQTAPAERFGTISDTSCGSFEPVEREVGDRGGVVVSDEMRCVVDVGELDPIGVPLRIATDTPHELLGPGPVAATEYDEGRHREPPAAVDPARHAHAFGQHHAAAEWTDRAVDVGS